MEISSPAISPSLNTNFITAIISGYNIDVMCETAVRPLTCMINQLSELKLSGCATDTLV